MDYNFDRINEDEWEDWEPLGPQTNFSVGDIIILSTSGKEGIDFRLHIYKIASLPNNPGSFNLQYYIGVDKWNNGYGWNIHNKNSFIRRLKPNNTTGNCGPDCKCHRV